MFLSTIKRILFNKPKGQTFHKCSSCGMRFFITSIENLYFKDELRGFIPEKIKNTCRICRFKSFSTVSNSSILTNKGSIGDLPN